MKVISLPPGLRAATALLLLCVPIAALETMIVARAPWWHVPYRLVGAWSGGVAAICLPLALALARGYRTALGATALLALVWMLASGWLGLHLHYPPLGFFTLFLLLYFAGLLLWLRHEIGRSFFDPRLPWYQGLPKPIPGLQCEVGSGEKKMPVKVSRLDLEGAFLYSEIGAFAPRPGHESEVAFAFRDRQIRFKAVPVVLLGRSLGQGSGAGMRFASVSPDQRKELGDFIEELRGEGYVD